MTRTQERIFLFAFLAIPLFAILGVRIPFWGDEAGTWEIITLPWSEFWKFFVAGEPHPPLYFALLKLWSGIFGTSERALRLPSVLLYPAMVFLTWKLSEQLRLKRNARIFATGLAALHPSLWICARMARYYIPPAVLVLSATCLLLYSLRKGGWRWVFYGISMALIFWTDFPAYLTVPMHFAVILWKDRKSLLSWSISLIAAALTAIPALGFLAGSAVSYAEDSAPTPIYVAISLAYPIYTFLIGEVRYPWQVLTNLGLIGVALLFIRGIINRTRLSLILAVGPIIAGLLILAIFFQEVPFTYYPGRLAFLFPGLMIAVAAGVEKMNRVAIFPTALLILAGYLWGINGALAGEDYINRVYDMPWVEITEELEGMGVRSGISRDWGAVHYMDRRMEGILLRDALEAELPGGRVAHVWRSGAFKLLELDSLVQRRLISERGEPIREIKMEPEDPTVLKLKENLLGAEFPRYIIKIYVFEKKEEPHVPGISG